MKVVEIPDRDVSLLSAKLAIWFQKNDVSQSLAVAAMTRLLTHIYQSLGMDRAYFQAFLEDEWERSEVLGVAIKAARLDEKLGGTMQELQQAVELLEKKKD